MKATLRTLAAGVIVAAFLIAPSAQAQDEDTDEVRVRAKRVIIEVDDEGRILLDGRRLSDRDGAIVLRVEPQVGEVQVEAVDPRDRRIEFRGGSPHREHDRVVYRRGDGPHPFIEDFDIDFEMPDIPDVAPLLERLRINVGDPIRASLAEHREVAELERESRELARRARSAEGQERRELEADLRVQLQEIFQKKVELRTGRIAELEERLHTERDELQRRRAAREEVIERRLRSLMGEDDILDW